MYENVNNVKSKIDNLSEMYDYNKKCTTTIDDIMRQLNIIKIIYAFRCTHALNNVPKNQ